MANNPVFRSNINIGQNGAENDEDFLISCFVDHPALAELVDLNSPALFALGSTGIGKTAILKMIEHQEEHCNPLEVHDMAMAHLANSDTIAFLQSLDIDLSLFFQALWKHVLCIEFIRLVIDEQDREKFWISVRNVLLNPNRGVITERLRTFVEENENRFWNTIDQNVIELTDKLESNMNSELGVEIDKFKLKAGYARSLSGEKRVQLQQRAKKFVNQTSITELSSVISGLAEYTKGRQDRYFMTIDGLDENWVDNSIKYQLIQALFESLRGLRKLRNFKAIVALRSDLFHKMIGDSQVSRGQFEKYSDLVVQVKWTKEQLWRLAERRIGYLFSRKYSSENVHFYDIFLNKVDGKIATWNYLIERTLNRPRDVINFINSALQASEGKTSVSKTDFLSGEGIYSDLRLETLVYEWGVTFPDIRGQLTLLVGKPEYFQASEIMTSKTIEEIYDRGTADYELQQDPLWHVVTASINGDLDPYKVGATIFQRLHLIGAVGLKTSTSTPWNWIAQTNKVVPEHSIDAATKVKIHPMLYKALNTA
ncbi:MAG: P-loop ATPase, Sll1717 family [Octadecabacter sp.]